MAPPVFNPQTGQTEAWNQGFNWKPTEAGEIEYSELDMGCCDGGTCEPTCDLSYYFGNYIGYFDKNSSVALLSQNHAPYVKYGGQAETAFTRLGVGGVGVPLSNCNLTVCGTTQTTSFLTSCKVPSIPIPNSSQTWMTSVPAGYTHIGPTIVWSHFWFSENQKLNVMGPPPVEVAGKVTYTNLVVPPASLYVTQPAVFGAWNWSITKTLPTPPFPGWETKYNGTPVNLAPSYALPVMVADLAGVNPDNSLQLTVDPTLQIFKPDYEIDTNADWVNFVPDKGYHVVQAVPGIISTLEPAVRWKIDGTILAGLPRGLNTGLRFKAKAKNILGQSVVVGIATIPFTTTGYLTFDSSSSKNIFYLT